MSQKAEVFHTVVMDLKNGSTVLLNSTRALLDALAAGGVEARRTVEAMLPVKKIDIATNHAARRRLRHTR
jgi:hypothetical protein